MSQTLAGQHGRTEYLVQTIGKCRVIFGNVPLSDFSGLTKGFSKKAVVATDLADRIGATFVIGEIEDVNALREAGLPVSEKRIAEAFEATRQGLPKVAWWLREGERGASSNAMCRRLFGFPAEAGIRHPLDPDDLRRCLSFLDAVDGHAMIGQMADVSPEWRSLVAHWDEIVDLFHHEFASDRGAPKTFVAMQQAIGRTWL